ncbi:uncharacterized protein L969DRAFT_89027 [Mixia osmundae IAM 14324]|uniref:uncharacterized protein n=1 Tax=Mixia osmundae (strain CBS 9802 / IAM 14324 / JCM 22182 / KY 12970) TaxID=764103 RepID=UPI0004A54704|nr:uncharacterized protein L969DRAFT_89027 [Mixia osmundae IAM 14324]KEI38574.1 hypothetical protein L969DRAFT_89027 [Mixia osmundae IAM 14324]
MFPPLRVLDDVPKDRQSASSDAAHGALLSVLPTMSSIGTFSGGSFQSAEEQSQPLEPSSSRSASPCMPVASSISLDDKSSEKSVEASSTPSSSSTDTTTALATSAKDAVVSSNPSTIADYPVTQTNQRPTRSLADQPGTAASRWATKEPLVSPTLPTSRPSKAVAIRKPGQISPATSASLSPVSSMSALSASSMSYTSSATSFCSTQSPTLSSHPQNRHQPGPHLAETVSLLLQRVRQLEEDAIMQSYGLEQCQKTIAKLEGDISFLSGCLSAQTPVRDTTRAEAQDLATNVLLASGLNDPATAFAPGPEHLEMPVPSVTSALPSMFASSTTPSSVGFDIGAEQAGDAAFAALTLGGQVPEMSFPIPRNQDAPSANNGSAQTGKWEQLGISLDLLRSITKYGLRPPSKVLARAIPCLLESQDIVAQSPPMQERIQIYIVPAIQIVANIISEAHGSVWPQQTMTNRRAGVLVVVVTATVDQATQAARLASILGGSLGVETAALVGQPDEHQGLQLLTPHIVIGTPARLTEIFGLKTVSLANVRMFVVDETDQIIARGMAESVLAFARWLPANGSEMTSGERQTAVLSCTVPQDVLSFASCLRLREPVRVLVRRDGAQSTPNVRTTKQYFLYIAPNPARTEANELRAIKLDALLDLCDDPDFDEALIYCSSIDAVDSISYKLQSVGIDALALVRLRLSTCTALTSV